MYHFLSGYTARVAGTEKGVTEPKATFSTCFGAPFLPLNPNVYARMLGEKIAKHGARVWLVNTGWTGGPYGVGKRMKIANTRAMITAALTGQLDNVQYKKHPVFNLDMPTTCPGVPESVLDPRSTWPDAAKYDEQAKKLAKMFVDNFVTFEKDVAASVKTAGTQNRCERQQRPAGEPTGKPSSASKSMHSCRRGRRSSAAAAPGSAHRRTPRSVPSAWRCRARSLSSTVRPSTTRSKPRSRAAATSSRGRSSRARTTSIPTCRRAIRSRSTSCRSRLVADWTSPSTGKTKHVGLTRIHMEEDAGKSLHEGFPDSDRRTYVDYNRSGVPLIEIVSEPDMRSAAEAAEFFSRLRNILVWLGVSDGNMEEGSLRCDANVSVRPRGQTTLGTKAEVKNVNSFRYLEKALEYEISAADRCDRGRWEGRAGDAALGHEHRPHSLDAQQGRGARLSLLP